MAQNVTSQLTIGQTYTQSAYLKGAAGGEVVSVSMYSTDGTYTAMQASYTLSATQWTRVQATGTITSAVSGKTMQAGWGTSTLGATIYAWQPQLVVGTGPGLCTHTTSTTTAVSQGIVDQCQIMPLPNTILTSNSSVSPAVPAWLQYLSTGADGANTNASGNMNGEYYYTNFTVPYGNTVNVNYAAGLTIHATGTCTIAGTIEANGATAGSGGGYPIASSGGGGSGGGAAAGTAGQPYYITVNIGTFGGGTAGALSGGNGSNGGTVSTSYKRIALASGGSTDGQFMYGGAGKTGGSSGGAGGNGGASVVLICGSIVGTDGTHTGIIDASGQAGSNATANSTGAGSGGGGGVVILSSQSTVTTWPTINTSGGAGGTCGAFTTCGTGGAGGAGWSAEFQGW